MSTKIGNESNLDDKNKGPVFPLTALTYTGPNCLKCLLLVFVWLADSLKMWLTKKGTQTT